MHLCQAIDCWKGDMHACLCPCANLSMMPSALLKVHRIELSWWATTSSLVLWWPSTTSAGRTCPCWRGRCYWASVHTVSTQLGFHCLVGEKLNPLDFAVACFALPSVPWTFEGLFLRTNCLLFSRSRTGDKLAGGHWPPIWRPYKCLSLGVSLLQLFLCQFCNSEWNYSGQHLLRCTGKYHCTVLHCT